MRREGGALISVNLIQLVNAAWADMVPIPFTTSALTRRLLQDGGLDAADLTEQSVHELLSETFSSDWSAVVFAMSELVAYYLALGAEADPDQIVGSVFSACVLADAARVGVLDWTDEHQKVSRLAAFNAERMSLKTSIQFHKYLFGKGGNAPIELDGA
jgi:hypothetical protein